MSWPEFLEWQVFDALEPIGFKRDDHLAAHIAQAAVAPHVKELGPLKDFMPFDDARFDQEDEDEAEFTVSGWIGAAVEAGIPVVSNS